MYDYKTLENTDFERLHRTFLDAFSDYPVKSNPTPAALKYMLQRRGYVSEVSMGAFENPGQELVGFIFNGLRTWNGHITAYDTGTGVVPSSRRQGVTNHMFQQVLKLLSQNNVRQYLLEVLQDNTAAVKLYQKQGFQITRPFSVHRLDIPDDFIPQKQFTIEYPPFIPPSDWKWLKTFWDFNPSWQNSIASIAAVQNQFTYLMVRLDNRIAGYGIIDVKTGDVPQLAVHKDYRRRGIASQLLSAMAERTEHAQLSVVNVDDACEPMLMLLQSSGFRQLCSQYEMLLPLQE